jgi:hypothetical protein
MDSTTLISCTNDAGCMINKNFNPQLAWEISIFGFILALLTIIGVWKMFTKAGEKGWKSIIPFYNTYILFKIAGYNGWWFLGLIIPVLNIVLAIMLAIGLAKNFGKGVLFAIFAILLLSPLGFWIIGFGGSEYRKA